MAYIPRSSFIPKQAPQGSSSPIGRKSTVNVFGLVAMIALVLSVSGSVGVFFYNTYLEEKLQNAKIELGQKSTNDSVQKIREIKLYDYKLNVAHTLLDNHLAVANIFEELQNSTKETIRFNSFKFEYDPGFDVTLSLGADTAELASVVLQEMQFLADGLFSGFLVKDISLNDSRVSGGPVPVGGTLSPEKTVGFVIQGTFTKDLLRYTGESASPNTMTVRSATPLTTVQSSTEDTSTTVFNQGFGTSSQLSI